MKNKIKRAALSLSAFFICLFVLAPALAIAADSCDTNGDGTVSTQEAIQCGANGAGGSSQSPDQATKTVNDTIKSIINLLSVVIGVVAVIMIIISGFRYITSGGKQESVASAKNGIIYAIIGLIVVAVAQAIARFVLTNVTKR